MKRFYFLLAAFLCCGSAALAQYDDPAHIYYHLRMAENVQQDAHARIDFDKTACPYCNNKGAAMPQTMAQIEAVEEHPANAPQETQVAQAEVEANKNIETLYLPCNYSWCCMTVVNEPLLEIATCSEAVEQKTEPEVAPLAIATLYGLDTCCVPEKPEVQTAVELFEGNGEIETATVQVQDELVQEVINELEPEIEEETNVEEIPTIQFRGRRGCVMYVPQQLDIAQTQTNNDKPTEEKESTEEVQEALVDKQVVIECVVPDQAEELVEEVNLLIQQELTQVEDPVEAEQPAPLVPSRSIANIAEQIAPVQTAVQVEPVQDETILNVRGNRRGDRAVGAYIDGLPVRGSRGQIVDLQPVEIRGNRATELDVDAIRCYWVAPQDELTIAQKEEPQAEEATAAADLRFAPRNLEVSLYPNPASAMINVEVKDPTGNPVAIQVYDITGKMVRTANTQTAAKTSMNVSDFGAGVYIYRVIDEGTGLKATGRFVVE